MNTPFSVIYFNDTKSYYKGIFIFEHIIITKKIKQNNVIFNIFFHINFPQLYL